MSKEATEDTHLLEEQRKNGGNRTLDSLSDSKEETRSQASGDKSTFDEKPKDSAAPSTIWEDLPNILLLFLCYLFQFTVSGVLYETIPLYLMEKKISPSQMGVLSFMRYPFALKFLVAPLTDIYYWRSFGRKKSYVIPSQYVLSIMLLLLAVKVDALIEAKAVVLITIFGILIKTATAIQDIALDSWVVTLVRPENYKWGSSCAFIAAILGHLIGFNMLIHFSNVEFCNKWLYSEPQDVPVLTLRGFLLGYALVCAVVTLLIHLYKKEQSRIDGIGEDGAPVREMSLKEIYKTLFCGSTGNRNMVLLMIFVLCRNWAFVPNNATITYRLVKKGLKKERISEFLFWTIPLTTMYGLALPSFAVRIGHEMKVILATVVGIFLESFLWYRTVDAYENDLLTTTDLMYRYIAIHLLSALLECLQAISMHTLFNRLADLRCTGTFITLLNAISNAGHVTATTFTFFAMTVIPPSYIIHGAWILGMFYWSAGATKFLKLEKMDRSNFQISAAVAPPPSSMPRSDL
eukprot:TRINITY_DN574_c0_g1_i1.p1 TRINITY_DN574_c0_g1~~TRINITY_DN574_c0_g1_i1.p1  ORF type:complete len:519 (-),score=133.21 TRINITY_DN574_c0_g1_i1:1302-2858(-)